MTLINSHAFREDTLPLMRCSVHGENTSGVYDKLEDITSGVYGKLRELWSGVYGKLRELRQAFMVNLENYDRLSIVILG